ncbi:MAG TPA: SMC-Scp complex subunit ScpB [Holophagaceae bacterium]|nr:SMC-Scp complex subunit ScpB [Holophagaceae bacterium]
MNDEMNEPANEPRDDQFLNDPEALPPLTPESLGEAPEEAEAPQETAEASPEDTEPLWEAEGDLPGALEALFTAAGEVLDIPKLRALTGFGEGALRQGIEALQARLAPPRGLRLVEVGGGWRMATSPTYAALIAKLVTTVRSGRLTPAQLESLAIVAYRQPVTITEINAIRGVTSSANQIKSLMERDLIVPAGRKAVVGRPMMYATTQAFLLHFGLKSLFDLPRLADFGEGHLEAQALASLEPELEDGLFAHPHPDEAAEYDELLDAPESQEEAAPEEASDEEAPEEDTPEEDASQPEPPAPMAD